jgi:hypothetical protein
VAASNLPERFPVLAVRAVVLEGQQFPRYAALRPHQRVRVVSAVEGSRSVMEIAGQVTGIEQEKLRTARGRFVKGVSGNPGGGRVIQQCADELFTAMRADFGEELSGTDEALLRQAAWLLARARRGKCAPDECIRMSSVAHRIIAGLRKHAAPAAAPAVPLRERWLAEVEADDEAADEAQGEPSAGMAAAAADEAVRESDGVPAADIPGGDDDESTAAAESLGAGPNGDEAAS